MAQIDKSNETMENSSLPFQMDPLNELEQDKIRQFQTKFQQMDQFQRRTTISYLSAMVDQSRSAFLAGKQHKKTSVTFSYPQRGHPNDGNPALMSVIQLLQTRKLTVKENEYSKERAIWLCEDFNVSWKPKNNHSILANALEQIGKQEF
jgi:hypothetical protein